MSFVLFKNPDLSFDEMLKEKFVNISGNNKFKTREEFELLLVALRLKNRISLTTDRKMSNVLNQKMGKLQSNPAFKYSWLHTHYLDDDGKVRNRRNLRKNKLSSPDDKIVTPLENIYPTLYKFHHYSTI